MVELDTFGWKHFLSFFARLCAFLFYAPVSSVSRKGEEDLWEGERERNVLTSSSSFSSEFLSIRRWCWDCVFTRHRLALYGVSFYRTREMMLGVDAWEDRMFAGIRWKRFNFFQMPKSKLYFWKIEQGGTIVRTNSSSSLSSMFPSTMIYWNCLFTRHHFPLDGVSLYRDAMSKSLRVYRIFAGIRWKSTRNIRILEKSNESRGTINSNKFFFFFFFYHVSFTFLHADRGNTAFWQGHHSALDGVSFYHATYRDPTSKSLQESNICVALVASTYEIWKRFNMEKWDEEATKQIRTNWPTNYRMSDILWNKRREFSRECALRNGVRVSGRGSWWSCTIERKVGFFTRLDQATVVRGNGRRAPLARGDGSIASQPRRWWRPPIKFMRRRGASVAHASD